MGCGSSAAVASASLIRSQLQHRSLVKDAGSQTNVTVLIASTTNARNEAHDARKEQILLHRAEVLARAKEISNSKSGYTTATYTGSAISTPRSAYSRTRKTRGSDCGSGSDVDQRSGFGSNTNLSRTDLSTKSSNARKSQVSFRNDEYKRIATNHNKRRKSYMNRGKTSTNKVNDRKVSTANSERSESSGSNSINKQVDTGYEGSVSSGPSSSTLITSKQTTSLPEDNPGSVGVDVVKTFSSETHPEKGRLSTVVSIDEQSIVREISSDVVTDHKSEHQLSELSITKEHTEPDGQSNNSALQNGDLTETAAMDSLSDENKAFLNPNSNPDNSNLEVDDDSHGIDVSSSVVVVGGSTSIKSNIPNLNKEESVSPLTIVG